MTYSPTHSASVFVAASISCLAMLFSGCNNSTPSPPPTTGTTPVVNPGGGEQVTSPAQASTDIGRPRRQNERWADANGVQYLGNVPLDVFFDQPYSVVQDATPIGTGETQAVASTDGGMSGGGMSGGGAPVDATAAKPLTAEPAAAAGNEWTTLLSVETLLEEVNTTRNFMKESLQTVGAFNSSMLMIPPKAAVMAALASIAMEYPGEITWKEDAKYIRDFAKQMNESTLQRGRKDQVRLLELYESMSDTLNRSKQADLKEPPETDTFVDVAAMGLVMMRMQSAEKRMKNEAGSETAFTSQKKMILHEAAMLGTMTKVVTMSGYGYEDDAEFLGYAKRIVDAAIAIRTAVEVNDFATYEQSLSNLSTACTECHSAFKN